MKIIIKLYLLFLISLLLSSCSISPIKNEIKLPKQNISENQLHKDSVRIVLYNNASFLAHGLDRSGHTNVKIDGKNLGRLDMWKYVIVDLKKGVHSFNLAHRDIFLFPSSHTIKFEKRLNYVELKPLITSNSLKITKELPKNFKEDFKNGITEQ